MEREKFPGRPVTRAPLRWFRVYLFDHSFLDVQANLVFNNDGDANNPKESLVFRKYYDNDVSTEVVAEFTKGSWLYYAEKDK